MISLIWTNPRKGLSQKRVLQRDAFEGETYFEAIPTTAILTSILFYTTLKNDNTAEPPIFSLRGSDKTFFLATYATSVLTASIGLAKALKTGPCKIIPEGKLLSFRFRLLIFTILLTLIGKWSSVLLLTMLFENEGRLLLILLSSGANLRWWLLSGKQCT